MARQAHAVHCRIGVGEIPEKVRRIAHRVLHRQFVAVRFRCARHLIVTARADGTSGGITVKLDQVVHHGIKQGGRHQGQFTIALLDTQFETAAFLGVQVRIAKAAEPLIKEMARENQYPAQRGTSGHPVGAAPLPSGLSLSQIRETLTLTLKFRREARGIMAIYIKVEIGQRMGQISRDQLAVHTRAPRYR